MECDTVGTESRKGCFRTKRDYEKKNGIPWLGLVINSPHSLIRKYYSGSSPSYFILFFCDIVDFHGRDENIVEISCVT